MPGQPLEHRPPAVATDCPARSTSLELGIDTVFPQSTYEFSASDNVWLQFRGFDVTATGEDQPPESIVIASYNVLAGLEYPPNHLRYPLLLRNIISASAIGDVLILQEVTDDFLSILLESSDVRQHYGYSTHPPSNQGDSLPVPSRTNIVVLARFPFQWSQLRPKKPHQDSAVLVFPTVGQRSSPQVFYPLVLAACHFTRGLTDSAVDTKRNELHMVLEHLKRTHPGCPWILAGDLNLSTSRYTISSAVREKAISPVTAEYLDSMDVVLSEAGFADSWVVARSEMGESSDTLRRPRAEWEACEGEQGATFDPTENPLAASIVAVGYNKRPQRSDRILVKGNGLFRISGFNMFGFPLRDGDTQPDLLEFASDHWGVRCLLRLGQGDEDPLANEAIMPVILRRASGHLQNLSDLRQYVREHCRQPTEEARILWGQAFAALKEIVSEAVDSGSNGRGALLRIGTQIRVVAVGSYGLGCWTEDSDLDCLCIGPFSPRTFFTIISRRIRKANSDGFKLIRRVLAKSGTMLELDFRGVRVDLQYCMSPSIAESWPGVMKRPATDPIFDLPSTTLLKLKPIRDLHYLLRSIPDLAQFRTASLVIKAWAKERGVYSARFGYLGGIHLSSMLVPICKVLFRGGQSVSAADIITTFFDHYSTFQFDTRIIFDPYFHKKLQYSRGPKEPMCLLGWHPPAVNVAWAASAATVNTIASELKAASELLSRDDIAWPGLLGLNPGDRLDGGAGRGAIEFLGRFKSYLRIDIHHWGPSPERANTFVGWLGSRCVHLLVEIDQKLPDLAVRFWPAKFAEPGMAAGESGCPDYRGCYLGGLEWAVGGEPTDTDRSRSAQVTLRDILSRFEERIHGDVKYYDSKVSWMAANVVPLGELGTLQLDRRIWVEQGEGDTDPDEDDGDDASDSEVEAAADAADGLGGTRTPQAPVVKPGGQKKLRTAADVMNRLRWDGSLDSSDYVVGYEDRFLGPREKALDQWKSEQTDEEFIPQHRILYFRRKSDGVLVWDRKARRDDLFGSGIPS